METLDLNNKRKREKLTASEWNSLINAINLLILRYNQEAIIPTKLSQLINDAGFITDISGKADKSELARVATTGSYNDLKDKPNLSNIGSAGKSAYELAVENGYQGSVSQWLASLKGQDGTNGTNGTNGVDGTNGTDGITPYIDPTSKHWMIGETDTGILAEGVNGNDGTNGNDGQNGNDGITPHIDPTTKHWMIGSTDTGIVAEGQNGTNGQDGTNGTNGTDGITPHIDQTTGNWFIGKTNTGVSAQGPAGNDGSNGSNGNDGITPHIDSTTGNWFIGNTDTGVHAQGPAGQDGTVAGQLQADWNQTDNTQTDYIKNKPDVYTKKEINNLFTGYDYIEIGGVKWATMNVGANSITDVGLYFQWGDIQGYTTNQVGNGNGQKSFKWEDYKYANGASSPTNTDITKYNITDNKTVLEAADDAATINMGLHWRMPTAAEYVALGNAVNTAWTADYQGSGVAGLVCTDKTDSSKVLFFPAAGSCYYDEMHGVDYYGSYWLSSLDNSDVRNAYYFNFSNNSVNWQYYTNRRNGSPIRGVFVEKPFLSTVAYSGDYDNLSNKPTIPQIWSGTQAQYDLIQSPDPNTIYIIIASS